MIDQAMFQQVIKPRKRPDQPKADDPDS